MATRLEKLDMHTINIPVGIIDFVLQNKMSKPFQLFTYLKCHSSGKVHEDSSLFQTMPGALEIKDQRTIRDYVAKLYSLNWMGYNPKSGYYFIRGFNVIRKKHNIRSRKAAIFDYEDINYLATAFLPGAVICSNLKAQQYVWEVSKRRLAKSATENVGVANQGFPASDTPPPYYGLSNKGIAASLYCKQTRACELKQQAEQAGYLKSENRFKDIAVLYKPDYKIREIIKAHHPELGKRVRFKVESEKGLTVIKVVQQLHNEIIPYIRFKNVRRFSKIRRSA
jgi:hypothetical protein